MTSSSIRPRVHWVSPLPPAETDIAHYTARIVPELAERCDLVLWTDAPDWDRRLEDWCEVRRFDPDTVTPRDFARAGRVSDAPDAVFVHLGNSWIFHSGLLRLVRRIPSIVVLHDLAVQELVIEAVARCLFPAETYLADMRRWYGERGRAAAAEMLLDSKRAAPLSQEMPGFEIALDRASAVLTHVPSSFEAVTNRHGVSTYLLDLPFRPSWSAPTARRDAGGPLKFVQFGYIAPNRRLAEVLEALAPLKDQIPFRFDIMGSVWDPAAIRRRVQELGLEDRVTIHGFVPEETLDATLREAHLVFNLRHPTMGEASGSQLRIWNAAAASVVTDLGWYHTLPDETVFKIPLEGEREALQGLVRNIAADRDLGVRIGAAGRARLEARHTPARYADAIVDVARRVSTDAGAALKARVLRRVLAETPATSDAAIAERLIEIAARRC